MAVTPDDVRRMAELAALRLRDEEVRELAEELGSILEHMDALREVEPGDAEPSGTAGAAPLRPDRADPDPLADGPGVRAPGWQAGFFTVPRLASHEAEAEEGDSGGTS